MWRQVRDASAAVFMIGNSLTDFREIPLADLRKKCTFAP